MSGEGRDADARATTRTPAARREVTFEEALQSTLTRRREAYERLSRL